MANSLVLLVSLIVAISGCQPLTKPRSVAQGANPEHSILRQVDTINRGIAERISDIPKTLHSPTP